jgi:uncharacterized membrane protein
MSTIKRASGLVMAVAAAGLIGCNTPSSNSAGAAASMAKVDQVHCYGVNTCKGHNDCKTASNACKGQGSCKAQGFVALTAKACGDVGGTIGA